MELLLLLSLIIQLAVADKCQDYVTNHVTFTPIRIHFEYNFGSEFNLLRNTILPHVLSFLQDSVSVRPQIEAIRFPRTCRKTRNGVCIEFSETKCGRQIVPNSLLSEGSVGSSLPAGSGVEADLVVFVSVRSDMGGVKADAGQCLLRDICGRPLGGQLNVNSALVVSAGKSSMGMDVAITTLIHEFFHIFAFAFESFSYFRDPDTLAMLEPSREPIYYRCSEVGSNKYEVEWNVKTPGPGLHLFRFASQVIKPLSVRGLLADECRCPTDPNRTYSNGDIEDCLRHANKCAMAVVTPGVVSATRSYFGCPSAEGMEIENAFGISCSVIHQSHWKQRVVSGELMTPTSVNRLQFISPMSFALLEDSGWYKMNHEMVSSVSSRQFPGVFWGYQQGCPFLQDKCISNGKVVSGNFCLPNEVNEIACSIDLREKLMCSDGAWRADIEFKTQIAPYQYDGGEYIHGQKHLDYCPAFEPTNASECPFNSRCMQVVRGTRLIPQCVSVVCSPSGESFEVVSDGLVANTKCTAKNQLVYIMLNDYKSEYFCADPQLVCASWKFPHVRHFKNPPTTGLAGLIRTRDEHGTRSQLGWSALTLVALFLVH